MSILFSKSYLLLVSDECRAAVVWYRLYRACETALGAAAREPSRAATPARRGAPMSDYAEIVDA
jgi:hypothetical protein